MEDVSQVSLVATYLRTPELDQSKGGVVLWRCGSPTLSQGGGIKLPSNNNLPHGLVQMGRAAATYYILHAAAVVQLPQRNAAPALDWDILFFGR